MIFVKIRIKWVNYYKKNYMEKLVYSCRMRFKIYRINLRIYRSSNKLFIFCHNLECGIDLSNVFGYGYFGEGVGRDVR